MALPVEPREAHVTGTPAPPVNRCLLSLLERELGAKEAGPAMVECEKAEISLLRELAYGWEANELRDAGLVLLARVKLRAETEAYSATATGHAFGPPAGGHPDHGAAARPPAGSRGSGSHQPHSRPPAVYLRGASQ